MSPSAYVHYESSVRGDSKTGIGLSIAQLLATTEAALIYSENHEDTN